MKFFYFLLLGFLLPILTLAQDVYEIRFTAGITQYRGALIIYSDGTGKMRTRYYDNGATRMVEQYMRIENTTYGGTRISGYDAVYPGTTTKYPNYNPDNFYISQDENGNLLCVNIDDDNRRSTCTIRIITGSALKQEFLSDFNWTLN